MTTSMAIFLAWLGGFLLGLCIGLLRRNLR